MATKKNPGGRPTKYAAMYCDQLLAFFDVEPWELREVTLTLRNGTTVEKDERYPVRLPTFERFAHSINVHVDTMIEWTTKKDKNGKLAHPKFSEAYKRAKQLQKDILIENGLQGAYNTPWSIFLAKNITDLRDKQDHEVTGKDGEAIVFDIMGTKSGNADSSTTDTSSKS